MDDKRLHGARESQTAMLSCENGNTSFSFGGRTIRFRTSDKLKRYLGVRAWDGGYLVLDAEYEGIPSPVEEYIDLEPILRNLYFDSTEFLSPIKEVCIV